MSPDSFDSFIAKGGKAMWVTTSATPCASPNGGCAARNEKTATLKTWIKRGLPKTGWSACGGECSCVLVPMLIPLKPRPIEPRRRARPSPKVPAQPVIGPAPGSKSADAYVAELTAAGLLSTQFDLDTPQRAAEAVAKLRAVEKSLGLFKAAVWVEIRAIGARFGHGAVASRREVADMLAAQLPYQKIVRGISDGIAQAKAYRLQAARIAKGEAPPVVEVKLGPPPPRPTLAAMPDGPVLAIPTRGTYHASEECPVITEAGGKAYPATRARATREGLLPCKACVT